MLQRLAHGEVAEMLVELGHQNKAFAFGAITEETAHCVVEEGPPALPLAFDVPAVQQYAARCQRGRSADQTEQGRFAAAGRPVYADKLASLHDERNVTHYRDAVFVRNRRCDAVQDPVDVRRCAGLNFRCRVGEAAAEDSELDSPAPGQFRGFPGGNGTAVDACGIGGGQTPHQYFAMAQAERGMLTRNGGMSQTRLALGSAADGDFLPFFEV